MCLRAFTDKSGNEGTGGEPAQVVVCGKRMKGLDSCGENVIMEGRSKDPTSSKRSVNWEYGDRITVGYAFPRTLPPDQ
jgi:hypothetical protein